MKVRSSASECAAPCSIGGKEGQMEACPRLVYANRSFVSTSPNNVDVEGSFGISS